MNTRSEYWAAAAALVVLVGSLTCPASERKGSLALTSAIPDDVFFCWTGRHNPDRTFLEEYWSEVFDALDKSGIGADFMELLGGLIGQEGMVEVNRLKERASQLISAVDWDALGGGEFVFAERMPEAIVRGKDVMVAHADLVWLLRGSGNSASRNYQGLVGIVEAIVEELKSAIGPKADVLRLDKTPRLGTKTCTLNVVVDDPEISVFDLSVALHGDVIVIAVGDRLLTDVLNLLDGKGAKKPLSAEPRFQASLAKLPDPEDSLTFFDMQALLRSVTRITDKAIAASSRKILNAGSCKKANALNDQAIKAYKQNDYKQALELIKQAHEAAPEDSLVMYNLSCFHALGGHSEEALKWLEKSVDGGFYDPRQIAGDRDLKTIRGDQRFQTALAKANKKAVECCGISKEALAVKAVLDHVTKAAGIVDHIATVEYTDGYTTHTDSMVVFASDAAQNPLFPVFGRRKPVADFDRYLPVETVSFSVSSGIDLGELYKFLETTVASAGAPGEHVLATWKGIQESAGLDVREDVLSWIHGDCISISLGDGCAPADVWMVRVNDEVRAREKVASAVTFVTERLTELVTQNPMLGMLMVRTEPSTHEMLEGFHRLQVPISPQAGVWGVKDGFLILGTSEEGVALVLATAAGKHPNIRENKRVMAQLLMPDGPAHSISFTDRRKMGEQLGGFVQIATAVGGMATMMIPNPKVQQAAGKVVGMLGKLGPVVRKINFYESTASYTTRNGDVWHTRSVTHYKPPAERKKFARQATDNL